MEAPMKPDGTRLRIVFTGTTYMRPFSICWDSIMND